MGGLGNLEPGTEVPVSGKYKCVWCGTFVHADSMGRFPKIVPTVKFFRAGKTFKMCPRCGGSTGWTLIEECQPTVKWWEFWK